MFQLLEFRNNPGTTVRIQEQLLKSRNNSGTTVRIQEQLIHLELKTFIIAIDAGRSWIVPEIQEQSRNGHTIGKFFWKPL